MGINIGYTRFAVALIALLPLLFSSNRHTVGVFLLMYGGPLAGITRSVYSSLPIYGLLLELLGVVLVLDLLKDLFRRNIEGLGYILFTLLIWGIFYVLGPRTDFAATKYFTMCTHGVMMVLGYYVYSKAKDIDAEGLTQILIVSGICSMCYMIHALSMHVSGFLDYNWLREQDYESLRENNWEKASLIGYQYVGMLLLFGITVFLSQVELKKIQAFFYLLCTSQLILTSGCRQAMLGLALVVALRLFVFKESNLQGKLKIGRLLWIAIGSTAVMLVFAAVISMTGSEAANSTLQSGDVGRFMLYMEAIAIFEQHPIVGSGIGGYEAITGEVWPHNFFLELLCETGIIGSLLFILLMIVVMKKKNASILYVSKSNMFYFLIVFAIFVRFMFSSDFRESIELFSAIFAISAPKMVTSQRKSILPNTV